MAELTPKERLLPSLLDRLTDNHPDKKEESREQRGGSVNSLRKSVLRDLEWLLNTVNLASVVDFDLYPELSNTVLNYGMPGLSGQTIEGKKNEDIDKLIKRAIHAFEPRILKRSLRVTVIADAELEKRSAIAFQIEGMLWGNPMPEPLFLHTEFDLELGNVRVREI